MTVTEPLRLCLGLHLHQPVGNFDHVFRDHLDAVYAPLLGGLRDGTIGPVAMHLSGPLLDWLEDNAPTWVDRVAGEVDAGHIELLAAGHDEPILVALSPEDRIEQIVRHRERLHRRFGVEVDGLWLTERVWEPDLPRALAHAGVRFVVVDDRHLRLTGLPQEAIHRTWVTEHDGDRVAVFAIDERLRYLVPFRPVEEFGDYLRGLQADGHRLAVLADDGEKFGGWPGTAKWVWQDGWFARFADRLARLAEEGTIVLSRFGDALEALPPDGPIYLPSASYREMERWALPAGRARALEQLEERDDVDPTMLRGGHWRHFLAKYPEVNRLHKTMAWLSRRCRVSGEDPVTRRHIGRAQCNDAYWHGVFGGSYLPFLRSALWQELATAARRLPHQQPIASWSLDLDLDGHDDIVVQSAAALTVLSPSRGMSVIVHLDLMSGINHCDVMSRHEEAYHPVEGEGGTGEDDGASAADGEEGMPSIHDLETRLTSRPAIDHEARGLLVDRFLGDDVTREEFLLGSVVPALSLAAVPFEATTEVTPEDVIIRATAAGITKTVTVGADGSLVAEWRWDPTAATGAWFSSECSSPGVAVIEAEGAECWAYPIETVSKSEKGFDDTHQGTATVLRWPVHAGHARVRICWNG